MVCGVVVVFVGGPEEKRSEGTKGLFRPKWA
jgi:hypothetical protein